MAEKIEFIPASNLPTTEAEEVDVLCVENGKLKRKSSASLGGIKYDAVIYATLNDGEYTPELIDGSYDAIRAKVLAHEFPNIAMIVREGTWHETRNVVCVQACEDTTEDSNIFFNVYRGESQWFGISPDNTVFVD